MQLLAAFTQQQYPGSGCNVVAADGIRIARNFPSYFFSEKGQVSSRERYYVNRPHMMFLRYGSVVTDMAFYRSEGVSNSDVCDLLERNREALAREVSVPAPESLKPGLHDVKILMERFDVGIGPGAI